MTVLARNMGLEGKLERQLNRARAADLVELVQAAAEVIVQGRLRQTKETGAIGEGIVERAEIGMIEDVEKLAAELKIHTFREIELAMERKVHLPGGEAS